MNQVVTLTSVEVKSKGSNKRGPWALRIFDSAGGTKFQTFDVTLGESLEKSVGSAVEIEYEVEENGNFTNNVVKSFKAASGHVIVPENTHVYAPDPRNVTETERQLRIMRQSALDRAINTVAAGIAHVSDFHALFEIADEYILYFEAGISAFTPPNEVPEEAEVY